MTLSERRYYKFAVLLSLIFHAAILFIHFALPMGFYSNPAGLETMAPGLMDLPPGSPNTQPSLEEPGPVAAKGISQAPETVTVKPESLEVKSEKDKPADPEKTEVKVDQPKEVVKREKPKEAPRLEKTSQIPNKSQSERADNFAKTDDAKSSATKKGREDGSKNGEGEKAPPAAKNFGTGELMVAGGLDIPLYYPKNAQNEGKEGDVTVRLFVDSNGKLENAEILRSSGDPRLDNNALSYGQRLTLKGINEKYYIDYLVSYRLDQDGPKVKYLRSESRL